MVRPVWFVGGAVAPLVAAGVVSFADSPSRAVVAVLVSFVVVLVAPAMPRGLGWIAIGWWLMFVVVSAHEWVAVTGFTEVVDVDVPAVPRVFRTVGWCLLAGWWWGAAIGREVVDLLTGRDLADEDDDGGDEQGPRVRETRRSGVERDESGALEVGYEPQPAVAVGAGSRVVSVAHVDRYAEVQIAPSGGGNGPEHDDLVGRLRVWWPRPDGPRSACSVKDCAEGLGVSYQAMRAALDDAGVQVEKLNVRPLGGGSGGQKWAVTWSALQG